MKTGILWISDWAGHAPHFEAIWASEPSWAELGANWSKLGRSWGLAGRSWPQIRPMLRPAKCIKICKWPQQGTSFWGGVLVWQICPHPSLLNYHALAPSVRVDRNIYIYLYLYIDLSLYLSLAIYLSLSLSIYLYLPIHLPIYLSL
jgi:hypothetical protein